MNQTEYEIKRNEERNQEIKAGEIVIDQLREIAKFKNWEVVKVSDEPRWTQYAEITNGKETLFLTANQYGNKGKIAISGVYPKDKDGNHYRNYNYGETLPSINVSLTKTPEQFWKDVERRLMTGYKAHLEIANKRLQDTTNKHEKRNAIEKRIALALGENYKESSGDPCQYSCYLEKEPYQYARIDAKSDYSGESVKVEADLCPENALKVIELIKALSK